MAHDDALDDAAPAAENDVALVDRLWRSGTSATAVSPATNGDLMLLQRFLTSDDRTVAGPLLRRHVVATWRLAAVVTLDTERAAAALVDAWSEIFDGAVDPVSVRSNPRAWLLSIVRRHALRHGAAPGTELDLDEGAARIPFDQTGDASLVAASFAILDEVARTAVWLHTVEGFDDADIAHVVELDRLETHELVDGAMGDLRVAALRGQLTAAGAVCRGAVDLFAPYLDDDIADSDEADLLVHLEECRRCSARLDGVEAPGLSLVDRVLDPPKAVVDELRRTAVPARAS